MKFVKAIDENRINLLEALYLRAFPAIERKPFMEMLQKQEDGTMELLSIEDDENTFLGLAILAYDRDIALLDYFAISDEIRGQGIGSDAIRKLQELFQDRRLVLEIESTKVSSNDLDMRIHRKNFYLRNGLHTMNFDVNLFGVEMEILSNAQHLTYEEYIDVYKNACHPKYAEKIFLI